MSRNQPHPGELFEISGAYWRSCTLHAGVKLDVFTAIGDKALAGDEVAGAISGDLRGVTILLNALVAMGILERRDGKYGNTPESRAFLSMDSPRYIGYMILHHHDLVESWGRLHLAVKTGKPVRTRSSSQDEGEREAFLMGMFNNAMAIAPRVAKLIDLKGRRRFLDLGGGPGTYAIHFCLANPELEAVVYDLPTTRPFAEKTIERFDVSGRIRFEGGNYLEDPVPGRYDVAWLSQVLHAEGPEDCAKMIRKAASALEPGGLVIVHEFLLNDMLDSPEFPAIFSLNMLVGTPSGRAYSEGQIREMLAAEGVRDIRRLPFQGPTESGILIGTV